MADFMYDSANPPTADQARAALGRPARIWAGYIGGPSVYRQWSRADFDVLRSTGWTALPIYAGRWGFGAGDGTRDGDEAAGLARALGFAGGLLLLDMEREPFDADPGGAITYIREWSAAVRRGGFLSGPYGPSEIFGRLDESDVDFVWPAGWGDADPVDVAAAPGLGGRWPSARAWQYRGEIVENGVSVDKSVVILPAARTRIAVLVAAVD